MRTVCGISSWMLPKVYAVLAQARQELLSGEQARLPCQRRRAQFYL
jgi:hypothetical protein